MEASWEPLEPERGYSRLRSGMQVDVRTLEAAPETDPVELAPALRRDADELEGFLEFLTAEIAHPGLRATVLRSGRSMLTTSIGDGLPQGIAGWSTTNSKMSLAVACVRCLNSGRSCVLIPAMLQSKNCISSCSTLGAESRNMRI